MVDRERRAEQALSEFEGKKRRLDREDWDGAKSQERRTAAA